MDKTFYIIEDHDMLRWGTISYIQNKSSWKCLGDSKLPQKAISDLESFARIDRLPGIVISDLNFKDEDSGFDLVKQMHGSYPNLKIIVFSMYSAPGYVQSAIRSGANGYISKDASSDELIDCMEQVLTGNQFVQNGLRQKLEVYNSFMDSLMDALTKREKEVLNLLLMKKNNDQIAEVMGLRRRAVENYMSHIYEKTNVTDRAALLKLFG